MLVYCHSLDADEASAKATPHHLALTRPAFFRITSLDLLILQYSTIVHPMLQPCLKQSILQYSNDDKSDWLSILVQARRQSRRSMAAQRSLLWAYFHPEWA